MHTAHIKEKFLHLPKKTCKTLHRRSLACIIPEHPARPCSKNILVSFWGYIYAVFTKHRRRIKTALLKYVYSVLQLLYKIGIKKMRCARNFYITRVVWKWRYICWGMMLLSRRCLWECWHRKVANMGFFNSINYDDSWEFVVLYSVVYSWRTQKILLRKV